jgi:DNA-binding HxlR family transcriptional regulator
MIGHVGRTQRIGSRSEQERPAQASEHVGASGLRLKLALYNQQCYVAFISKVTTMQHPSDTAALCPVALSLDRVGEGWSFLILRDACRGLTRFGQFEKSLGIAPNILARRLRGLVEAGLLEKSRYSDHPPRDAYLLTERGRDFGRVLGALFAWGNKHFMAEGRPAGLLDSHAGVRADTTPTGWNERAGDAACQSLQNTEVRSQP